MVCDNDEKEDIYHCMLHCTAYNEERSYSTHLHQPYIESDEDILGQFLFNKGDIEERKDSVSVDQELDFGVPQGSVLGPGIHCMYIKPVSDIIQWHGLSHHSYADDTQLYMTMDHSNNDWRDGLARIELCVSEIREWMNQNMLKLNYDKTELIVFTSKYKHDLYNYLSITIGVTGVDCSSQV